MQDASLERPPIQPAKWSASGCALVGCVTYFLFAAAQTVALLVVLAHVHPDFIRQLSPYTPAAAHTLRDWILQTSTAPNLFLFAVVGDGVMIVLAIGLSRLFFDATGSQIGLTKASQQQLLNGALVGIGLIFVSQIVTVLQAKLFGPHPEQVAELLKTHHGSANFLFDFAAVCVIAPFAEELLFRGVIFAGLVQRMPLWPAAIVSGIIFGVAHLDPWSVAPLAVIGVGLALLYYRTGSIWPNVIAHATVNTVALVAVYAFPQFAT